MPTIRLPDGRDVLRLESILGDEITEDEPFLVTLGIPLGALEMVWPEIGGYLFGDGGPWILRLAEWLRGIGEYVFDRMPFAVALIGFEASDALDDFREHGVPEQRWAGYLTTDAEELRWRPPTEIGPAASMDP